MLYIEYIEYMNMCLFSDKYVIVIKHDLKILMLCNTKTAIN